MGVADLLDGVRRLVYALAGWIAALDIGALSLVGLAAAIAAGISIGRRRRRKSARALAARAHWSAHYLKEQLRRRMGERQPPFGNGADFAPTMGALEAFEADIEAAATTVLVEAGGHRGRAKYLLRQRLLGDEGDKLNGTAAACWRQLGALCLLDDTPDALKAYSRATELNPKDVQGQMLVGVLCMRAGRLEAAERAFRSQIDLAGEDGCSGVRHRAGTMLGDVLAAKGEREAAMAAYEAARQDAAALSEREPASTAWRRDLSITHDRIGDMLLEEGQVDAALESYQKSLAIADSLAKQEPDNAGWQRDLSVAHDRLGEALERKGDLAGALASFRAGLALAEALARRDPERPDTRWDVSVSLDRIGDMLVTMDKLDDARAAYRRGLEIAEEVARGDPSRTDWQRDLAVSLHKVGSLEAIAGDVADARELLEQGRAIIARLDRIAAYRLQWRSDLAKFDQALRNLGP